MRASEPTGKIITFYSYKGGTGRSMALANIAWILASAGCRVLVLDWDLEAPGLHRYFRPFLMDKELNASEGIIDYIIKFCDEAIQPVPEGKQLPPDWYLKFADITRYRISLDYEGFPQGGKIDFICAGQQGPSYATRVNSFNWQDFYQRLGGGAFINATREQMRSKYDYILVDSRTGVSDTAGICTVQLPDTLAIFFTYNNQSISGASAVAQSVADQRKGRIEGRHPFRILPVPTRVDQTELDKLDQRRLYARQSFATFIEDIPELDRANYWTNVEVPYVAWFAYEEVLSIFRDSVGDPKTVLASLKRIADFVVQPEIDRFVFEPLLSPEQKQEILNEFAATPTQQAEAKKASTIRSESPLEEAIRLAEVNYLALTDDDKEYARQLWLRLVRVPRPGERVENSKVRVPMGELVEIPSPVLDRFISAGLLITSRDDASADTVVEVANEDVLRNWKRLLEWIDENRQFLLWRQLLQTRIADFKHDPHATAKLLSAEDLQEARKWRSRRPMDLNSDEQEFILNSEGFRQSHQRNVARWAIVAAAGVLGLVVIIAAFLFYKDYRDRHSLASNLVNSAEEIVSLSSMLSSKQRADRLQLAILLELEADRIVPSENTKKLIIGHLSLLPQRLKSFPQPRNVQRIALTPNADKFVAVLGGKSSGTVEDKLAIVNSIDLTYGQSTKSDKQLSALPVQAASGDLVLSDDGSLLAFSSRPQGRTPRTPSGLVEMVWDLYKGLRLTIPIEGNVLDTAISPDNHHLAVATSQRLYMIDLTSSLEVGQPPQAQPPGILEPSLGVDFSADGNWLAVVQNGHVTVRQITRGSRQSSVFVIPGIANQALLSPSGKYLACEDFVTRQVSVWEVAAGKQIAMLPNKAQGLTFGPSDDTLIVLSDGVSVWKIGSGEHTDLAKDIGFSDVFTSTNGQLVAAVGSSGGRVWRSKDNLLEEVAIFPGEGINDLAFSGGNIVATGSDNAVRIWDLTLPNSTKPDEKDYCSRLTRNFTNDEWTKYFGSQPYRQTCRPADAAAN